MLPLKYVQYSVLWQFCLVLCHTIARPLFCGKADWKGTLSGIIGIMGLFSEFLTLLAMKIGKSSSNLENLIGWEVCSGIQLLFVLTSSLTTPDDSCILKTLTRFLLVPLPSGKLKSKLLTNETFWSSLVMVYNA